MDLDSPWSDFYDLLLQDEGSPSDTEEEWTSVQKTARGAIECQPMVDTPIDPEFQTFVNQVLATVSRSPQRHYHFHHHSTSSWTPSARPVEPSQKALMPGTFMTAPITRSKTWWMMDVHAWITSIAFVAHLLLLWFRP